MRWMLEYLATKDRDGVCASRTGRPGTASQLEVVGDLSGTQAKEYKFPGPQLLRQRHGHAPGAARLRRAHPAAKPSRGARRGLAVIITDSQLHDAADVEAYSAQVAKEIAGGRLPRLNFVLVGVGDQVDEEQMEEICHEDYPGVGHLWCHRVADRMEEMAELVAVLVDETMTVAAGGTIYDDKGNVLKVYEARLPAVLEFKVPPAAQSFTLEVAGQRFTQPLPEEDHDDEEELNTSGENYDRQSDPRHREHGRIVCARHEHYSRAAEARAR